MRNIFSKRKYSVAITISGFVIGSLILFANCNKKELNTINPNGLPATEFWKTADDAEKGLVGCYGPLTTIPGWGRMLGAILTIQRGDDVNPFASTGVQDVGTFNAKTNDGRVAEGWGELNAIVARANSVIAYVPNINMDDAQKERIVGEAYFLRGFAHFYLLNAWGHIPLITTPLVSLSDLDIEQASQDDVWASIISDCQEAQKRLPQTVAAKDIGRATWGAATALLGKSYLYTKKWSEAATEFKKVIDRADLYQLVANYQDNCLQSGDNNKESIWELQYQSSSAGNWGASGTANPWRGQAWEPDIAPIGFTSQGTCTVNQWVFDLFMKQKTKSNEIDPRAYASMIWNYPGAKVYQLDFTAAMNGENANKIWIRKYLNFDKTNSLEGDWPFSTNNRRMIRLADVLLMYAEAINESNGGPNADAYTAINRVRSRANMPDITVGLNQDDFRTAVRDERMLELAFEGERVFDLLRWGTMATVFKAHPEYRSNSGSLPFKDGFEYLPIPQNDINANPKIQQNQGYSQ